MTHEIHNNSIAITVDLHGAELKSIIKRTNSTELLWQGDPAYWHGQSPILFPTVGNCYEQTIRHNGMAYPMPKHGLVKDMTFGVQQQTENCLRLSVESNDETLRHYPFPFRLDVTYRLEDNRLDVVFAVTNKGKESMPFLLGAHPGFLLPDFNPDENLHGYLGMDVAGPLVSHGLRPGGLVWKGQTFHVELDKEGMLPLRNDTFRCDTILDSISRVRACTLYNKEREAIVTMHFDSPVLALWAPNDGCAPFVCIEPWWGLCDEEGYSGEFASRPFINIVHAGETANIRYTIEIH